uniref:Putative deoxyhypusine synthase n=1 Tax=Trypanosoma vivax (strain Y486) TaxID=1055687 RepID=G0U5S3_TRYVY|nr:putative deoxyhypusine synthase [Trypanosoma vivax Y486]
MAELAQSAVLVSSSRDGDLLRGMQSVSGPGQKELNLAEALLHRYQTVGFQASHLARAFAICEMMLKPQPPSTPLLPEGESLEPSPLVQPTIFLGVTANLLGTGCREAIRFLCAERAPVQDGVEPAAPPDEMGSSIVGSGGATVYSPRSSSTALIHALVVSGGAMEHDIRRACESYRVSQYGSEEAASPAAGLSQEDPHSRVSESRFGNVRYRACSASSPSLFSIVMHRLVSRLVESQNECRALCAASPPPSAHEDVCSWAITPSALWHAAGRWLSGIMAEALLEIGVVSCQRTAEEEGHRRAQTTVLYWAAVNNVPIFSPSITDGDIMEFIFSATRESRPLQLDLVMDIHRLNKLAMRSRRTGMIILGGGVVEHPVCNANLMRNGANYAVFLYHGPEF